MLTATGPTTGVTGPTGDPAVTNATVDAGTYTLPRRRTGRVRRRRLVLHAGTLTDDSLVLPNGVSATCTIDNDDVAATLTLVKTVTNDNGGTALPTAWTLAAAGPTTGISGPTGGTAVTAARSAPAPTHCPSRVDQLDTPPVTGPVTGAASLTPTSRSRPANPPPAPSPTTTNPPR